MKVILLAIVFSIFLSSCREIKEREYQLFQLSTTSDSAAYHYQSGWQEIMDYGNYSKAEMEWRKAKSYDKRFLLNLAVLARVTQNTDERLILTKELERRKDELSGDERAVLDIYLALTHYTNFRD